MKLHGGPYIITGLVAFLAITTFPIWYGAVVGAKPAFKSPPNPQNELCIEPKGFMRDRHMQLLNQWRDDVVRRGDRVYIATDGKKWNKSLTQTCMACHGRVDAQGNSQGAAMYCGQCHDYVHVTPYCWDCHIDPGKRTTRNPGLAPTHASVEPHGKETAQR